MNESHHIEQLMQRIDELEMRVAFQEDTLQTLSEQIACWQQVSEQQQEMLRVLYRQWRDWQESAGGGFAGDVQEKPPHY